MSNQNNGNRPSIGSAGNYIHYNCGCMLEYQLVGTFAHIPEWHTIPCSKHVDCRSQIEEIANEDWTRLTDNVRGIVVKE